MLSENWKGIAELLGITAIVASLVFVGLELRQSQRIAFAEQEGAQVADFLALDTLLSSNAGLIQKANSGANLTNIELAEATILAETLYRSYFFINQRAAYLEHPSVGYPVMAIALILFENPGLRHLWLEKLDADTDQFAAMRDSGNGVYRGGGDAHQFFLDVQSHLATLDQMATQTP